MLSPRGPSRAGSGGGGGGGSSSPIVVPVRDGVQRFTPRITYPSSNELPCDTPWSLLRVAGIRCTRTPADAAKRRPRLVRARVVRETRQATNAFLTPGKFDSTIRGTKYILGHSYF
jgi:hypothetical protein